MSCCNQKRTAFLHPEISSSISDIHAPALPAEIFFRYIGAKSLTVFGAVTGIPYRFDAPGVSRAIDRRDAPGMMAVPMLERAL